MVRNTPNVKKAAISKNHKLSSVLAKKSLDNSIESYPPTPKGRKGTPPSAKAKRPSIRSTPGGKSSSRLEGSISKRRFKPGTKSLREIRKYQKTTNLLIPKLPFMRLVQEILRNYSTEPYRLQSAALEALQEMTELLLVDLFSQAVLCSLHANRRTIMVRDMELSRRIRGRTDIINP